MGRIGWYKRDPNAALRGMQSLSLEERGAYNTVLDLIYSRDNELPDDDRFISGHCGCDVRVWRRIKKKLLAHRKLYIKDGLIRNETADKVAAECLARSKNASNAALIKHHKSTEEISNNNKITDAAACAAAQIEESGDSGGKSAADSGDVPLLMPLAKGISNGYQNDTKLPKSNSELSENNDIACTDAHANALRPFKKENKKESTGIGLERRSLSPGGPDPPPTQPDPKKFAMKADWKMTADAQTWLSARFEPELGTEPFWRQVRRFIDHHSQQGEPQDQAGFERLLEGWLERADANREGKRSVVTDEHKNGTASAANGHDPPTRRTAIGLPEFVNQILEICGEKKEKALGTKELTEEESEEFKHQAFDLYDDLPVVLGVSWGPNLTADEVFASLAEFEGFRDQKPDGQRNG